MPKKILKESYDLWTTFECLKMSLTYFYYIIENVVKLI